MARPRPSTAFLASLTKRELSAATGVTIDVLDKMVRAGLPATATASKQSGLRFDLPKAVQWMLTKGDGGGDDSTLGAKRRLAIAQAAKIEQQNAVESGRFVDLAEMRAEVSDHVAKLRDALLAVPSRISASAEVQAAVRVEIEATINTLAEGVTK